MNAALRMRIIVTAVLIALSTPSWALSDKTPEVDSRCMVGGCSGQLCGDAATGRGMVSNCMFVDYYACYPTFGECTRQPDGECGWTPTAELKACMANPPPLNASKQLK